MYSAYDLYCSVDGSCEQRGSALSKTSPAPRAPLRGRDEGSCSRQLSRTSLTLPTSTREGEKVEGWGVMGVKSWSVPGTVAKTGSRWCTEDETTSGGGGELWRGRHSSEAHYIELDQPSCANILASSPGSFLPRTE